MKLNGKEGSDLTLEMRTCKLGGKWIEPERRSGGEGRRDIRTEDKRPNKKRKMLTPFFEKRSANCEKKNSINNRERGGETIVYLQGKLEAGAKCLTEGIDKIPRGNHRFSNQGAKVRI